MGAAAPPRPSVPACSRRRAFSHAGSESLAEGQSARRRLGESGPPVRTARATTCNGSLCSAQSGSSEWGVMAAEASDARTLAFYYPGPIWRRPDQIKNLVLFFDGIALLVPEYMADRIETIDPPLVTGLREHGLLDVLHPEVMVDSPATEALATQLTDIIATGQLDHLADSTVRFEALSMSRMGWYGDPDLARMLFEELRARGLARETEDGVSVPMHPLVRNLVLVLLSQILRATGRQQRLDLSPTTDSPEIQAALRDVLGVPAMPSAGHVVSLDLEVVGVDLRPVAIEEALAFRAEHGEGYRAYARGLRAVVRELAAAEEDQRDAILRDRTEALKDAAAGLRETARGRLAKAAKGAGLALGLAGAVWAAAHGNDALGALLAGGGALAGAVPSGQPQTADAFSYLFDARTSFA
jgi:hypothetical protein